MFSTIRNLFSFTRKDDFSYLKRLAGKKGSFETHYTNGIKISSPFSVLVSSTHEYNVRVLAQPRTYSAILLAEKKIATISFEIPEICFHGQGFITDQSIADFYPNISYTAILDITDLLQQQLGSAETIDFPLRLQTRIDGKIYQDDQKRKLLPRDQEQTEISQHQKFDKDQFESESHKQQGKAKSKFSIFDLIYPILQRPLGQAFDNVLAFPEPLYSFQVDGVRFLIEHPVALLGDEMGLGKTIQAITACRSLFRQGKITSACVICPKAVLTNWEKELWRWAPELKTIILDGNKSTRELQWQTGSHIYICTYESLRRDYEVVTRHRLQQKNDLEAKKHFDIIILDEIQKTKNPKAQLTKTVRDIKADYRWGMSGTPLENSIYDLITICQTLDPDIFKNIPWTLQDVKNAYHPIFLRRRAKDVLKDLPDKVTSHIWLELSPTQRQKYDLAESKGIVELKEMGESVTIQHVIALITKLKLICNYAPESDESVKLDYLKDELEELTAEDNKALVFSQYPDKTLRIIQSKLDVFKPQIYDGTLSNEARNRMIEAFQEKDDNKIMLLSLKAGGTGLTLTRANYVFHFDMWWNPAAIAQATGRVLRIGQKKESVFEYFLLTKETIEERIFAKVEEKKQLFNLMVDDLSVEGDLAATRTMTNEELFGLFGMKDPKCQSKKPVLHNADSTLSSNSIDSLDPLRFEELVADLFEKMGYRTKLTKKTRDGGVDIYAKYPTPTGNHEEVIIQCKHKENPAMTVGVEAVREIYGVLRSNAQLTKAILVTNAEFSNDASKFALSNNVELIFGFQLRSLMQKWK